MGTPETDYSSTLSTTPLPTPLSKQISEIPDYSAALAFASTLTQDATSVDALAFGSPSTAGTMSTDFTAQAMQDQLSPPPPPPSFGYDDIHNKPRRTQLLPGTAPKSVDSKWKTRSARKKNNKLKGQKKKTKKAMNDAMVTTFPPSAFSGNEVNDFGQKHRTKGQGARLGELAERNAKAQAAAAAGMAQYLIDPTPPNHTQYPFTQDGSLGVSDNDNFGVPKRKRKKKREERYQDQIGVKLSWSAWMNKREDEKFHNQTIAKATSHVGKVSLRSFSLSHFLSLFLLLFSIYLHNSYYSFPL